MTFGPIRRLHGPTGVPADHLPKARNRFIAVDHQGRVTALVASGELDNFGAMPVHHTDTDDKTWDGPAAEANLSNDDGEAEYKKAFAWQDPDGDPDKKASYSFIHHEVNSDGEVGAANVKACSSSIGILNGGRGVNVKDAAWADDRKGIYNHMIAHLEDSGVEKDDLPELDDMSLVEARDLAYNEELKRRMDEIDISGPDAADALHACHDAAMGAVAAKSPEELLTPTIYRERTTQIGDPVELAAKIAQLRERQRETPDIERTKVKLRDLGGIEVEMAVRWDPEAIDPFARIGPDGAIPKGAFVSTLPKGSSRRDTDHAMVAAGADVPQIVDNPGGAWHAVLCVEGLRTDEDPGREIMPNACQFPDLPVSLRLQIEDEGGHWGAVTCGRIDTMDRQDMEGYNAILGTGVFGTNEHGQLAQLLVEEQTQRFISIDPRDVDIEIVEIEISTQTSGIGYYDYDDDECDDDNGVLYEWWVRYTNLTIGAATIVATPALQQAVIAMQSMELPQTPIAVMNAPPTSVTVTASGEPGALPPIELFQDPGFYVGDPRLVRQADGHYACPLTVDRQTRRVFGHVAYWGSNHTGLPGQNRKPPHSPTYAYFMTGARRTTEGTVAVGNLTMGCGHASVSIRSAESARAHYATPTNPAHYDGGYGAVQMADVAAGEDDFGIWVSGVLCEGVTEEQIRKFESLGMSGDWRMIAGRLHMVAVLAVPVPGFPIAREEAMVASAEVIDLQAVRAGADAAGEVFALVAAGRVRSVPIEERMSALERRFDAYVQAQEAEKEADKLLAVL